VQSSSAHGSLVQEVTQERGHESRGVFSPCDRTPSPESTGPMVKARRNQIRLESDSEQILTRLDLATWQRRPASKIRCLTVMLPMIASASQQREGDVQTIFSREQSSLHSP
jgi:hypothetical protein